MFEDDALTGPARLYQRTPFQVALVTFATFGFYSFYWLTRTVRQAQRILEREPSPWWHAFGMAIPVLNLFLYFQWFGDIGWAIRRAGLRPSIPYGFFIPVPLILTIVGNKAPNPWFMLSEFYFVPFAVVAYDMFRAESILQGRLFLTPRLSFIEIILVIFGLAAHGFVIAGALLDDKATALTPWVVACVQLGVLAFLVVFGILSKRVEEMPVAGPA